MVKPLSTSLYDRQHCVEVENLKSVSFEETEERELNGDEEGYDRMSEEA